MGHLFMVVHVLEMESKKVTGHRCFFSLILISLLKSSFVVGFFFLYQGRTGDGEGNCTEI